MPTPNEWLAEFKVNTGVADNETARFMQTIGLSNGNILVAWEEFGTTGVGTAAGKDIIAKIFDAEGNVVKDSYKLNLARNDTDTFSIAATNDGGFITVYTSAAFSQFGFPATLVWERSNAVGNVIDGEVLAEVNDVDGGIRRPSVVVNQGTNESFVTWVTDQFDDGDDDIDVNGTLVGSDGTIIRSINQATSISTEDTQDTTLTNSGTFITAFIFDNDTIRVKESDPDGTQLRTVDLFTNNVTSTAAPVVASLDNGNTVLAFHLGGDILYTILTPNGSTFSNTVAEQITDANPENENDPKIVALPDGGFVIVWDNDTTGGFEGQLFTAAGVPDGSVFVIDESPFGNRFGDLGVTADGRIVFSWQFNGDIFASIFDPRSGTIEASDYTPLPPKTLFNDGPITANVTGSTINGTALTETFLGQGGNDTINGGGGADTINGGGGADILTGGSGVDTINGGSGADTVNGGGGADVINGDGGNDVLTGFSGSTINGGADNDEIRGTYSNGNGDGGDDRFFVISTEGTFDINGGADSDTLDLSLEAQGGYTVNLAASSGTGSGFGGTTINLTSVENVEGSSFADIITTAVVGGRVVGGGGDDQIRYTVVGEIQGGSFDGGQGLDTLELSSATYNGDIFLNASMQTSDGANPFQYSGFENFIGSRGDETIYSGPVTANRIDGGLGRDTVDYSSGFVGVNVVLDGTASSGGDADGDVLLNIEVVMGTQQDDTLTASSTEAVTFFGNDGEDTITGSDLSDFLFAGDDDDVVNGGGGSDFIKGGFGGDTIDGGDGDSDTVDYSDSQAGVNITLSGGAGGTNGGGVSDAVGDTLTNVEILIGSGFNDVMVGDAMVNELSGQDGDDRVDGGGGADVLRGGAGNDTYIIDNIGDMVLEFGGDASDQVFTTVDYDVPENVELLIQGGTADLRTNGTDARDIIIGNSGNNTINGGGDGGLGDVMQGGDGNDSYAVDNSNDAVVETATGGNDAVDSAVDFSLAQSQNVETLILRRGSDTAVQAFGDDTNNQLFGNEFVNNLFGAGGTDFLLGFEGADNFIITPENGAVDVIGDWDFMGDKDRIGIAGFGDNAQVVQVSTTSFEIRSADGLTTQQFILQGYTGGGLVEGTDYFFG